MSNERDLAITLAGGGNRAFFQLGLLTEWWPAVAPRLGALSTCSAGACIAVMLLSERHQEARRYWLGRRAHVRRNLDWGAPLRGERVAPHYPIYRDTLLCALDEGGFDRIRATPFPVWALMAVPPYRLPIPLAVPIGLAAYSLERWLNPGRLHPSIGRRLGFEPLAIDLRTCDSAQSLAAVVLGSSATPPFTPVGAVAGRRVLDGGLVDNAPAFVADQAGPWRRHLVVLTRPYPASSVGRRAGRWYLCPSAPPPADRWDYTKPERIEATIALGAREARIRRPELETWLGQGS